eukprot:19022-Heterococcus_DN1.PRE.4
MTIIRLCQICQCWAKISVQKCAADSYYDSSSAYAHAKHCTQSTRLVAESRSSADVQCAT